MRSELEPHDIEAIVSKVVEELRPILASNNRGKEEDMIFDKKKLAEYLNVSVKWVDGYKSLGMPYYTLKGHVRFRKSAIDKWLDQHNVPAVNRIDKLMRDIKG